MRQVQRHRGRDRRICAAGVLSAAFVVSCFWSGTVLGQNAEPAPPASNPGTRSFTDRMNEWLFGPPAQPQPGAPSEVPQDPAECPSVGIRQGASTLTINAKSTDPNPMALRYQGSIGDTARECAMLGATMTIKVGVQGRIVLGPAGGPGHIDVPLRIALVREGTEPKTIWTKFYKLGVDIPPGQAAVTFTHVEQDLTVPMPPKKDLDAYIIYVGFDQAGAPEPARPRKKPKSVQSR